MSETHSLRLEINATAAKRGASEFEGAIKRIDSAVQKLDKSTDKAFSNVQKNVGKVNFSALARSIGSLNSLNLNPRLVSNLRNLASAISGMKAVSPNTVNSIRQLGLVLGALGGSNSSVRQINALVNALNNIKAPPAAAAAGINLIANAVKNLRTPSNTNAIVAALTSITNAATATYNALRQLGSLNVTVRQPRVTGGGVRQAVNPATGRAYGGVRPGYGFGPGRSAASGLRGFENVSNLSYQAGSAVRTAVGGLTAGAALQQITSVTREADMFRSTLTSVGVTSEQTAALQERLGQTTMRLGMDYMSVSQNLRSFVAGAVATGVSVQDASNMFENFSIAMRASGLGATQAEGALRALTQMFGKGKITAEEFRGQMAEHWSAFGPMFARYVYPEISDAAERMRRVTEDMEKRSFDPRLLIGLARNMRQNLGDVADTMAQTLDAAINRTKTAWALLMKEMGEGEAGKALTETFNRFAEILRDPAFRRFMQDVGVGLANVLRSVGDAAVWASQNIELVKYALTALLAIRAGNFFIGLVRAAGNLVQPFIAVGRAINVIRGGTQAATPAVSMLATAMRAVGSIVTGLFAAISAHPFVALGIAIAAVIAYFVDWGKVIDSITNAWPDLVESARRAWRDIGDFVSYTWDGINTTFITPLKEFASWVGGGFVAAWRTVRDAIKEAFDPESTSPFARALQDLISKVGELLTNLRRGIVAATEGPNQVASPGRGGILQRFTPNGTGNGANNIPELGVPDDVGTPRQMLRFQRYFRDGQTYGFGSVNQPLVPPSMPPDAPGSAASRRQAEDASMRRGAAIAWERSQGSGAPSEHESRPGRSYIGPGRGGGGGANRREGVENFFGRLDPSFRVMEEYQDGLQRLNQARQMGIGTAEQHAHWEGLLRDQFLQQIGAIDSVSKANRQYERALATVNGAERAGFLSASDAASARERLRIATEEARDPIGAMIRGMNEETQVLQMQNVVMEDEIQLLRIRNQLRQQGITLTADQEAATRTAIAEQRRANQAYKDGQEGLASWANSFRDFGTELAKLEEKFMNQFADALTEFVNTGKAEWRDLANSIVKDIQNLIIKQGIRELLSALGLISGNSQDGFSNAGSGIMGQIFGGSSNRSGSGPNGNRGILGEIVGAFGGSLGSGVGTNASAWSNFAISNPGEFGPAVPAASGGGGWGSIISGIGSFFTSLFAAEGYMPGARNNISAMMPAHAFVGAPRFAEGTGNTSGGMPAILHDNEAVIPLSRGRKVPVEGGGNRVVNNFNISTPDADSFRKSQPQILKGYSNRMGQIQRRGG